MIKTDFKPRKPRNPIFSEKKRLPIVPALLITAALSMIIWGISSQSGPENNLQKGELKLADGHAEIESENSDQNDVKSYEIDLNLGESPAESKPNTVTTTSTN